MTRHRFEHVLICEDIAFCQMGLELVVQAALPRLKSLTVTASGGEALRRAREKTPDLALIDLGLPDLPGLQVIRSLRALSPATRILVVTGSDDTELLRQATLLKVNGILHKASSPSLLAGLLDRIAAGEPSALDPHITSLFDLRTPVGLTAREYEVLEAITKGWTNARIAEHLKCSIETVRFHRSNIMDKTDIRNTAELTAWFLKGN